MDSFCPRCIKQLAVQRDQFIVDFRQPTLGNADALLQIRQARNTIDVFRHGGGTLQVGVVVAELLLEGEAFMTRDRGRCT